MCGIAGLYQWPVRGADIEVMADLIAHRGPDGRGVFRRVDDRVHVALAHLRLAIIDLSTEADQPFEKDGLVLVYNGEVYNYRELRRELEGFGVRFRTASDTEVVLEAWRRWGPDSLRRLRGMFAFAIYDERTARLVLARDHFGIKPLFVSTNGDGVAFASELKAILPVIDRVEYDPDALVASLMYYFVPDEHCSVKGVRRLPPGHYAEIDPAGGLRVHRYWSPVDDLRSDERLDADDLADIIAESVEAHLVADVPVSTFLSGGLDSSLITVLAKQGNPRVDAYTISFRAEDQRLEAMPDDLHFARIVAAEHDIDLHEIEIAPDITDLLPRIVRALDEPIGDAATINTVLICQAARAAGVKVLLSGMGADELFGGYRKHYACLLAARYQRVPQVLRRGLVEPVVDALPVAVRGRGIRSARWAKRFMAFASLPEEAAFRRSYTHYGREEFAELLSPDLMGSVDRLFDEHRQRYESTGFDDPVNRMCMTDTQLFMLGLNLTYTDRASMAESTEVRVPFIDLEVARAAYAFSGDDKIDGRERKAILKKAAERVLPREIVYRPKGLFSAPLRAWISRDLRELVNDTLPDGRLVTQGLVQRSAVERLIAEDRAGSADRSKEIWQLLTLEEWLRQHDEHAARAPAVRSGGTS